MRLVGGALLGSVASCRAATADPPAPAPVLAAEADAGGDPPPPRVELGRHAVTITGTRRVIPSAGLPAETKALNSNNNLDVIRHDGRVFLAWRTSKDHYASDASAIHVVSSTDETSWRFEATVALGTDVREPRFLALNGSLFLYLSRLGTDPLKFEPKGVSCVERKADGTWTKPEEIYKPGFLAWRTRTERDVPYMVGYMGGANIYLFNGEPLTVELLTTADGRAWKGKNPDAPGVYTGGGSETDFAITDARQLVAVIRNEAGDATGWGSKVCHADLADLARWTCKSDPKKYDSPYVFRHDGEVYLVGRRNISPTGNYDLGQRERSAVSQTVGYQLDYRGRKKRCSLWRFVPGEDRIAYVLDLPSRGDTCFAGGFPGATSDEVVLYNYSSDVDGPDVPWVDGQNGPTYVYRHVLRFTRG